MTTNSYGQIQKSYIYNKKQPANQGKTTLYVTLTKTNYSNRITKFLLRDFFQLLLVSICFPQVFAFPTPQNWSQRSSVAWAPSGAAATWRRPGPGRARWGLRGPNQRPRCLALLHLGQVGCAEDGQNLKEFALFGSSSLVPSGFEGRRPKGTHKPA